MRRNNINKDLILKNVLTTDTGCWLWKGTVTESGYGQVQVNIKKYRPHRLAMHLWKGFDLDSSALMLQTCDNKLCCNPEHLVLRTRVARVRKGNKLRKAKLTGEDILKIRKLYAENFYTQKELGEMFDVSRSNIGLIVNRINWSCI